MWYSIACSDAKSLPLFQQFARDHPACGDDVCPVSPVAATGRGSAVRTWHRHLPRDGTVLCQRRSESAAACRSKSAARTQARKPPISGAFLLASVLHFCPGTPLQIHSGVDNCDVDGCRDAVERLINSPEPPKN